MQSECSSLRWFPSFRSTGCRHTGSVVVVCGLWSAGSAVVAHQLRCSEARGIFPDQGSNPCPLHRQVVSHPLCHQGSPLTYYYTNIIEFWSWKGSQELLSAVFTSSSAYVYTASVFSCEDSGTFLCFGLLGWGLDEVQCGLCNSPPRGLPAWVRSLIRLHCRRKNPMCFFLPFLFPSPFPPSLLPFILFFVYLFLIQ